MPKSVAEVAKRFIGSYLGTAVDPDFADLFAPKLVAWHNYDAKKVEYDGAAWASMQLQKRDQLRRLVPDHTIENFTLHVAESAFILVHTSVGTLPDGTRFRVPACLVWSVRNGRIVSVNSISDSTQRARLDGALAAMTSGHGLWAERGESAKATIGARKLTDEIKS